MTEVDLDTTGEYENRQKRPLSLRQQQEIQTLLPDEGPGCKCHRLEWQKLRRTEGVVVHLLMHVANEWYGPEFIEQAWAEYTESYNESLPIEETPESGTSFVPWALFNYVPQEESDADPPNEAPLAFFISDGGRRAGPL